MSLVTTPSSRFRCHPLRRLLPILLVAIAALPLMAEVPSPAWLHLSGELRARFGAPTDLNFLSGANDDYLLTRLRLKLTVTATPWLKFVGEAQDSRGFAYNSPVPGSITDRVDLRQAFAETGGGSQSWSVRAGRQSLRYGKGRLIADPDWGNAGQVFDAVRVNYGGPLMNVSAFAGSAVVTQDHAFDSTDLRNMFYGVYGSASAFSERVRLEPYLLLKSNARVKNELGFTGALDVYTTGFRAAGRFTASADWESEMALQRGHLAGHGIRAFGGVWSAGWGTAFGFRPHLTASYTYASGDPNPRDGVKQTFDTLYPSVHLRNGASDRLGWANIHDRALVAEWVFGKRWRFSGGAHDFALATRQDGLYSRSGSLLLRNAAASSSHIGWELFSLADWKATSRVALGAGYAHLFRGAFLRDSGRSSVNQPYVFLAYRFGDDPDNTKGAKK